MEKKEHQAHSTKRHSIILATAMTILGLFSLLIGSYLGVRLSRDFRANPPRRARESDVGAIREWMTLRYIARAYGTPEPELEKSLNLEPNRYQNYSLGQIANELNIDTDVFLENTRQIIVEFQANHQKPPNH